MGLFGLSWSKNKEKSRSEIVEEEMMHLNFPCGEEEIKAGVDAVESLLEGRLSRTDCRDLYIKSKLYLCSDMYKNQSMMVPTMIKLAKGKISEEIALQIFRMLGTVKDMYSKDSGLTPDSAIVIGAPSGYSCIIAQYAFLHYLYGEKDVDWNLVERLPCVDKGRELESWRIRMKKGYDVVVWYDITHSMGKI